MKALLILCGTVIIIVGCQQRTTKTAGELPAKTAEKVATADKTTTETTSVQWLDSTYQDLGTVKEGPQVDIEFKFKNTGDKNLIIENVTASCGCTIVEKPQQPFSPGETGSIKAKFTTQNHVGPNDKSIFVSSNANLNPDQELKFHIVVEKSSS